MNFRISRLLAIAAFAVACLLGNGQSLAQNAYITNRVSSTVSVINTATNTVIATIPIDNGSPGPGPFPGPGGVAVSPDGSKVYIANIEFNTVSVIDTASNTVTATIPVGVNPESVAVTPDSSKVYVTNGTSGSTPGTVSVIDTATNTVISTIPAGVNPFGVAVTPDGSKVYVTNGASEGISVIDTATNTVTTILGNGEPTGILPHSGVAVSPDGSKVYVGNYMTNAYPKPAEPEPNRLMRSGHASPSAMRAKFG